jgi:hypothetical protein
MGVTNMTTTIVIDGRGREQTVYAPGRTDLMVRHKGFVALRSCGNRAVEIRYRPSLVKPGALLKTVQLLEARAEDRHVVLAWTDGWKTALVGKLPAAIAYLTVQAADAQSTRKRDFLSQRHVLHDVGKDAAFGRICDAWHTSRGLKDQRLIEAMREASCGRFLEVAPQDGASRLVIGAIGEGYSLYGDGWKSVAVGGRFEDMPDYQYARWASQAYREVFRTGRPVFEDITASVKLRHAGRLLLTYRRVILPIGGERPALLLGATLDQRVMRLGFEPSGELGDVLQ